MMDEHDINSIKRLAFNEGFKAGVDFIIEKCMADYMIGSDKMIEFPKSQEERDLVELLKAKVEP